MSDTKPFISSSQSLPEITVKAVVLGSLLSMLLAGANAYLGLFAGMTVSASIPAAVISMAIFKLFKKSNILENNIVQTAASAGESLAAGVIFTIPALALIGYWSEFNYWETTFITVTGGILGVLFTVPLRQALIIKQKLKFPEGVATAEVLKTGEESGSAVKSLAIAAGLGALMKFAQGGLNLWGGVFEKGKIFAGKYFTYFGIDVSPALVGVGYIVGLNISFLVFFGGVISWWIAIPLVVASGAGPELDSAVDVGYSIWNSQIRYLGVGAMLIGGIWALVNLRSAIVDAFSAGIEAFKTKVESTTEVLRTEKEFSMNTVLIGIALLLVPIFYIYYSELQLVGISFALTIIMVIAGFLFAAVAGYMAGLVGSSNNPISGVTIATILTASLILVFLMGTDNPAGAAGAIMVGAVVCCAAAIAGDNMQDLKAGHILGATPRNQQIMQVIGVVSAAMVMAPILSLLNTAYGFGPATPEHPNALPAPQASLAESVARGVFGGELPWNMIFMGMGIGALIIIADKILESKKSEFRMPVLAVAVGIYLPFELDSAIMLGGLLSWFAAKALAKKNNSGESKRGLLFASGLITGEALMGIFLAIPIAIFSGENIFKLMESPLDGFFGLILLSGICYLMFREGKSTD